MKNLIGLCGNSKSGKNFVADWLKQVKSYETQLAFAEPIKQILNLGLGIPEQFLWGEHKDHKHTLNLTKFLKSQRNLFPVALDILGDVVYGAEDSINSWFMDELLRAVRTGGNILTVEPRGMMQRLGTEWGREQVHQDLWVDHLLMNLPSEGKKTITDVRFTNEIKRIRESGGEVYRVRRQGQNFLSSHDSEFQLTLIPDSCFDKILDLPEGEGAAQLYLGESFHGAV